MRNFPMIVALAALIIAFAALYYAMNPTPVDLSGYARVNQLEGFAPADHTHDDLYAPIDHNHDGVYAPADHTHEAAADAVLVPADDAAAPDAAAGDAPAGIIPAEEAAPAEQPAAQ